ncbi:hypothetical protein [Enterococcus ratti]|nr:hypothetical protein [Enterococcus ratti]
MRKKRPFLLFWLLGFFVLLIVSVANAGKMTVDIQLGAEKSIASKESVDKFKKELSTYWWKDYRLIANYDKGELAIYLPKDNESNQFINIDDVLSAISLRQYQFKDKNLTILLLTSDGANLARLKKGKVITSYSDKVNSELVETRLKEWIKLNKAVKKHSEQTTLEPSTTSSTISDSIQNTTSRLLEENVYNQ